MCVAGLRPPLRADRMFDKVKQCMARLVPGFVFASCESVVLNGIWALRTYTAPVGLGRPQN